MSRRFTRRNFIERILSMVIPAMSIIQLTRCNRGGKEEASIEPCKDLSSLTEAERSVRQQLGYVEQSSFADRNCANCNLFVKPDETLPCGNCLVMKGPVADSGYCTVWAPVDAG